jgi:hypothetical protein
MSELRFRESVTSMSNYRSPWRTTEELRRASQARGYYARLNAENPQKPQRNTNFDGDIAKRRDRS